MKSLSVITIVLFAITFSFAQNEQSPIVEKEISYKNWTYKSIQTGQDVNLRDFSKGKKLVIVVYFAPWCGNWRHDAPFLQRFYDKYKTSGLEIVGVGEYDPIASMKTNLDALKITFPTVYESENRTEKQKTQHYEYRKSTGDTRNWGSPWYIFLEPARFEKKGDTLIKKTQVINGEMIEVEGEKFIRNKLGLPPIAPNPMTAERGRVEVCDPAKPTTVLKKP